MQGVSCSVLPVSMVRAHCVMRDVVCRVVHCMMCSVLCITLPMRSVCWLLLCLVLPVLCSATGAIWCCALCAVLGAVCALALACPASPDAAGRGGGGLIHHGGGVACPLAPTVQLRCCPIALGLPPPPPGGGHVLQPGAAGSLSVHVAMRAPCCGPLRTPAGRAAAAPICGPAAAADLAPAVQRMLVGPAPAMRRACSPPPAGPGPVAVGEALVRAPDAPHAPRGNNG